MQLIYVCSPYRGDIERNTARARRYCRFVQTQGEMPFASHLHNCQFMEDFIPEERQAGIQLGLEMLKKADAIWVFGDVLTSGMREELEMAMALNLPMRFFTDSCEVRLEAGPRRWDSNTPLAPIHGADDPGIRAGLDSESTPDIKDCADSKNRADSKNNFIRKDSENNDQA